MSERSKLVRQLRCIPCEIEDVEQPFPTEADHCNEHGLAGKKRRGDDFQIASCGWHHRGLLLPGWTRDEMTHTHGPSMAHDQKQFRLAYGDDNTLVAVTNHKIDQLMPATA